MFHAPSRRLVLGSPSLLIVSFIASIGLLFACHAYKDSHPLNLTLLGGFTLSIGYSVAFTCAAFQANGVGFLVLQAFMLTAAITVGLSAYTLKSKRDFSFMGAGLYGLLGMLIVGGLLNALVGWATGGALFHGAFSFVLALLGALLFSAYMCATARRSRPRAAACNAAGHCAYRSHSKCSACAYGLYASPVCTRCRAACTTLGSSRRSSGLTSTCWPPSPFI